MRRVLAVARAVAVACVLVAVVPTSAVAKGSSTLCVGGPGCFATIQAAVDAAHDGDTIRIAAGTFSGGVKIPMSVSVVGAGAGRTIIRGGGPVLTLGTQNAPAQPIISITGVSVTGGRNTTIPEPIVTDGGGIYIPPSVGANGPSAGATVTISDSTISGNLSQPSQTTDAGHFGIQCPPGLVCAGASARGGGIWSEGNLTLVNTVVSGNHAVTAAGFASGGGILEEDLGTLTLKHAVVTGNESSATAPYGIAASGGGVEVHGTGAVVISDSVIGGNRASLSATYPAGANFATGFDLVASGSGVDIDPHQGAVTITNTRVTGNTASAIDPFGSPSANSYGLFVGYGSQTLVRDSVVSDNHAIARGSTGANAGGAFGVVGPATIRGTRITGNTVSVTSTAGDAEGWAAFVPVGFDGSPVLLSDSVVAGNSVRVSASGAAALEGAGVANAGILELRATTIANNSGSASGASGSARGGGIWSGDLFGFGLQGALTLTDSTVTRNAVSGSPGLTVQGGGLFSTFPVAVKDTRIANNTPDQCVGC